MVQPHLSKNIRRLLLLLVILFTGVCPSPAQSIVFQHVGIEAGLSNGKVNNLMRDSQGFLWVSTSWGLDRYDGYEVRSLALPDSLITAAADVLSVLELDGESLLVKTTKGFLVYSRSQVKFSSAKDYFASRGITAHVDNAWVDNFKNLWILSNQTVTVLPANKAQAHSFDLPAKLANCCNTRYGLALLLENGCVLRCYVPKDGDMPAPQKILCPVKGACRGMNVDFEDNLWVLNARGDSLWFRRQAGMEWTLVNNISAWKEQKPTNITDVAPDTNGHLWLATESNGIYIVEVDADKCTPLRRNPIRPDGIRSNRCTCLLSTTDGFVFVGYAYNGFSVHAPTDFVFNNILPDDMSLSLARVKALASNDKGKVFVAADYDGIYQIDELSNKAEKIGSAKDEAISDMAARPDGSLFVLYADGQIAFSRDGVSQPVPIPDDALPEFRHTGTYPRMATDNDGNVWFASDTCVAVCKRHAQAPQFVKGSAGAYVVRFARPYSGDGVIALTCNNVYRARLVDGVPTFDSLLVADVAKNRPDDVAIDSQGVIWLTTARNQVIAYAPDSASRYVEVGRLSHITPVSILPLKAGGVGIVTPDDFLKVHFAPDSDTPISFEKYHRESLFSVGKANYHAVCQMPNGDVWMGTERGVVSFHQTVESYAEAAPVVFCNLLVNGEPVVPGKRYNEIIALPSALPYCDHVNIPVSSDVFSIRFAVPCASKSGMSYICELVGSDKKPEIITDPVFTFHNLPAGKYVFKVRAKDSMGRLASSEASLIVQVRTPWKESAWARGFMIVAAVIMSVLFTFIIVSYRGAVKLNELAKAQAERDLSSAEVGTLRREALLDLAQDLSLALRPLSAEVSDSANWKGLNPETAIRMNKLNDRLVATNDMIYKLVNTVEGDFIEEAHAVRSDVCSYVRQVCASVADIFQGSANVRFSSTMRNCFIAFEAVTLRYVVVDILSDAIVSAQNVGFINVSVERGRFTHSTVAIIFELGGVIPVGSRYFSKSEDSLTPRKSIADRLTKMEAQLNSYDYGDGMHHVVLLLPANRS